MKLIAGLGNPSSKYANTRHNLGFMVVDAFARSEGHMWRISKDWICYFIKASDYLLIKPSTFVNKSGEAVRQVAEFFKIESFDILIVHDDLDLPFGKIRISFDSMSAGHNGVESVIESLSGPDFARLRIGIDSPRGEKSSPRSSGEAGRPKGVDLEKYVLENFSRDEVAKLPKIIKSCEEAIRSYLLDGVQAAMNRFN